MPIKIPNGITIRRHSSSGGCSCLFYKITSKTGLKLFKNKQLALCSYLINETFSNNDKTKDLVPKVRSELIKVDGKYGYAVELVKDENAIDNKSFNNMIDFIFSDEGESIANILIEVARVELPKIKQFASFFGSRKAINAYIKEMFADNHPGNWGIKSGKYIWIDFSINYFN